MRAQPLLLFRLSLTAGSSCRRTTGEEGKRKAAAQGAKQEPSEMETCYRETIDENNKELQEVGKFYEQLRQNRKQEPMEAVHCAQPR